MSKLAMITGASRGLGAEYARVLAAQGYDLLLVARSLEDLQSLAQELMDQHGVKVQVRAVDLISEAEITELITWIGSFEIDLLVNNAGTGTIGLFAENPIEKSMNLVKLQIEAITRLTYAVLPGMLQRNFGDIVNVGSTIALMTQRYNVMYAATKYYLMGFAAALNRELIGKDVYVQTILPGLMRTAFYDTPEMAPAKLSVKIPAKFWMQPRDVALMSVAALNKHKRVLVPGLKNKLFVLLYQAQYYWRMFMSGSKKSVMRVKI